MSSKVTWGRSVSTYTNRVVDDFKDDLKSVATAMANHDQVDTVSEKHVDEAFSALARSGMNCKPFYLRADFWTGIGGLLVGISFSIPDVVNAVADGMQMQELKNASLSLMLVVFAIGAMLFFWSLYSSSVPRTRKTY